MVDAVCAEWDKGGVGVRLSPLSPFNDIADSDPEPLFCHVAEQLSARGLGYLHVVEGVTGGPRETGHRFRIGKLRAIFKGTYLANNGYTRDLALSTLAENGADLIAFGRPFIANPDLVERLRRNAPLNAPDPATFYGGDEHGYTDYPFLDGTI